MQKSRFALTVVAAAFVVAMFLPASSAPAEEGEAAAPEMRIFLFSAKPSAEGWQFMKANPGDRKAATARSMERIGGRMLAYYFGLTNGRNYILAALPDGRTAQAMLVQRLATDLVDDYEAIELVESSSMPAMFARLKEIEAADDAVPPGAHR